PGPTISAPGSPRSVILLSITNGPRWIPDARLTTSPTPAAAIAGCSASPGSTRRSAALAGRASTAIRAVAARQIRRRRFTSQLLPEVAGRTQGAGRPHSSSRAGFHNHPSAHLHVERVAEPLAIVPVDAG